MLYNGLMSDKIHILLADDDEATLRLFAGRLAEAGFEVLSAHDGDETFEIAKKFLPQLVLLDVHMPKMDGYEVLLKLKGDAATNHIPVMFLTNEDTTAETELAWKELGATTFAHKTEQFKNIVAKVNETLDQVGHREPPAPPLGEDEIEYEKSPAKYFS